jgi:hypothetical protein
MPEATRRSRYTRTELLELREKSPTLTLTQTARAFGYGIELVTERVKNGTWDITPVIAVGNTKRIPTAAVIRALGLDDSPPLEDEHPSKLEGSNLDAYIERVVAAAPEFSERQKARLAVLLGVA